MQIFMYSCGGDCGCACGWLSSADFLGRPTIWLGANEKRTRAPWKWKMANSGQRLQSSAPRSEANFYFDISQTRTQPCEYSKWNTKARQKPDAFYFDRRWALEMLEMHMGPFAFPITPFSHFPNPALSTNTVFHLYLSRSLSLSLQGVFAF